MQIEVIRDRSRWRRLMEEANGDVYDQYDYVKLNCGDAERPELFVAYGENGTLLYPYVRREIEDTGREDIVTAYGYGGPFRVGTFSLEEVRQARQHFVSYALRQQLVTETIRYHPLRLDEELRRQWCECRPIRHTVSVPLHGTLEEVEVGISSMTRRNIRKAKREEVEIVVADMRQLDTFIAMYYETMDHHHADAMYYFSSDYFRRLFESRMYESELLLAIKDGQVIAGLVALYGNDWAHYHLGASKREMLPFRPNHLLFHTLLERAHAKGKRAVHFGGGATGDDALFAFKQSFTQEAPRTFELGQAVLSEEVYERLTIAYTAQYGMSNYFPVYRTPQSLRKEEIL